MNKEIDEIFAALAEARAKVKLMASILRETATQPEDETLVILMRTT